MNGQSNAWIAGNNYVHFTISGTVTEPLPAPGGPFGYAGQVAQHNQYIEYSLETGVLFFIIDSNVYNREGYLIADSEAQSCSECLPLSLANLTTAAYPGYCDKFWLFFANNVAFVDLSAPNPYVANTNGAVINWDGDGFPAGGFETYLNGAFEFFIEGSGPPLNQDSQWQLYGGGESGEASYFTLPSPNASDPARGGILIDDFDNNANGNKYIAIDADTSPALYEVSATGIWPLTTWVNPVSQSAGEGLTTSNSIEFCSTGVNSLVLAESVSTASTTDAVDDNLFLYLADANFQLQGVTALNAHIGGLDGNIGDLAFSPSSDVLYFGLSSAPYIVIIACQPVHLVT